MYLVFDFKILNLQLRVVVYDILDFIRRIEVNVLININRNFNVLIFSEQFYFIIVQESVVFGINIRILIVIDNDGDIVIYEIIDQNIVGFNYVREYIFFIFNFGELIVKKLFVGIGISQFIFIVRVRDRRYLERFGIVLVIIFIVRDQFRFQCQSFNVVIIIIEIRGVNEIFLFYIVGVIDGDLKVEIVIKLKFGFNFQNLCEFM